MSYAQSDDDDGRISTFRERLLRELRAQTGDDVSIFQDRKDIDVGESWRRRLAEGLADATFLLPVITPRFLKSPYCREETAMFLDRERSLDRDDLVLPIYYIDCQDFLAATADEAVAAIMRSLLEKQYFDWRDLRLRAPADPVVLRKRKELAEGIRRAIRRSSAEARPAEVAQSGRSTAAPLGQVSLDDLLDALFENDPVTSWPAAREIAQRGPDAVPLVVNRLRDMTAPMIIVIRALLSQFAEVSAPLMVERLKTADRDWHGATFVPNCFSVAHAAYCQEDLAELYRDGSTPIDVVRKMIESLGYVGATDWAFSVGKFLKERAEHSSDYYDKYSGYCVEALARIVVLRPTPEPLLDQVAFAHLESAISLAGTKGWQSITYPNLKEILSGCKPHHGDHLLSDWLTSNNEDFRDLGAYALGAIGLQRAVPALLARCSDPHESDRVRGTAVFAVGVIGGTAAVDGLIALQGDHAPDLLDDALAICVAGIPDDDAFSQLAQMLATSTISERWWVYRAIGRRGMSVLLELVRDGLHDQDSTVRGDAALALARLEGASERERLLRARSEASTIREQLLTSLALLSIGEPSLDDPELLGLRAMLGAESYMYQPATKRDILEVLGSCSHPRAADLAAAWGPIYSASSYY
jgi:HEAT repeat protein